MFRSARTKLSSGPDESERDFRIRLQQALREGRDQALAKVREKHASRLRTAEDKLRRAQAAVERENQQASESKMSAAVSFGATVLGALLGRKAVSASTLGRATTAAKSMGRISRESGDVARATSTVATLEQQLAEAQAALEADLQAVQSEWDPQAEELERVVVKPKRGSVSVQLVGLVWQATVETRCPVLPGAPAVPGARGCVCPRRPAPSAQRVELKAHSCRSGGTGRRAGLKIPFSLRECGFDPLLRHQSSRRDPTDRGRAPRSPRPATLRRGADGEPVDVIGLSTSCSDSSRTKPLGVSPSDSSGYGTLCVIFKPATPLTPPPPPVARSPAAHGTSTPPPRFGLIRADRVRTRTFVAPGGP